MKDFKKERSVRSGKGNRRQYTRMAGGLVMMGVLGLVAFGSARAAWGMYQKFSDASVADAAAQGELANMKTQYASVSTTVEALQTERGLEAAIRARYGVGRPGEGEIDIVRRVSSTTTQSAGSQNWFERLWHAVLPF